MTEERVRIPVEDFTLEGVLHHPLTGGGPRPGVVVCHPHPLYGGDMDNPLVVAVCRALARRGLWALRFNFRGVGASGGRHTGGPGEVEDAGEALLFLAGREGVTQGRLGLAGYSFGAGIGAQTAQQEGLVGALALLAPPPGMLEGLHLPPIPILLLAGEADPIAPLPALQALARRLGPLCRVEAVPGADHFFWGREGEVAERCARFLAEHLGAGVVG